MQGHRAGDGDRAVAAEKCHRIGRHRHRPLHRQVAIDREGSGPSPKLRRTCHRPRSGKHGEIARLVAPPKNKAAGSSRDSAQIRVVQIELPRRRGGIVQTDRSFRCDALEGHHPRGRDRRGKTDISHAQGQIHHGIVHAQVEGVQVAQGKIVSPCHHHLTGKAVSFVAQSHVPKGCKCGSPADIQNPGLGDRADGSHSPRCHREIPTQGCGGQRNAIPIRHRELSSQQNLQRIKVVQLLIQRHVADCASAGRDKEGPADHHRLSGKLAHRGGSRHHEGAGVGDLHIPEN